jgi:cobalt transporter subunit CbtB
MFCCRRALRLYSGSIAGRCPRRRAGPHPALSIPAVIPKEEIKMQANLHPSMAVPSIATPGRKVAVIGQALLAALLGATLIWGVGFSQISAFHNAAHDTRHSNAFPCH